MDSDEKKESGEVTGALTETERSVAALWCEVLATTGIPIAMDNFFSLGGDSMTMVMVEYRIQEEFAIKLPAGAVLGSPTLRELSALIDAEMSESARPLNLVIPS